MTTATDTNVLIDLFGDDPHYADQAQGWITAARNRGDVIICPVVYGELVPNFNSKSELDTRLRSIEVQLSPINDAIAYEAGRRWQRYRQAGGTRTRMIADFLIGAHALAAADTFLTRDRGFYRTYFPELSEI